MADGYNNADYAFILPNYFPAPGQVLQSAIARQDKQAEFDYENQIRAMQAAQKKAEDDRMRNLGVLSKETEFGTQYATPDLQVNSITQKNLQRIKNKGYELINQSPEKFNNWLNSEVSKVAQWNNMAKTDATNIKERQKEINSTYQNIDINKANSLVSKSFLENYTQVNPETGELEIKEVSSVVPNKNYFEQFDNPKNLASIVTDVSPFYNWFTKVQSSQTGDSQSVSKNGVVNKESWTGYVTPYTKVDFDEKGKPFISVTSVSMPYTNPVTGKTESMPIADDSLMTDVMAKPDTKIAAYKAWEDEKAKRKVDYKDPVIDEIMFKNFIYNTANRLLPHEVKTQEVTKAPVINVSTGDKAKQIDYNLIKGITSSMKNSDNASLDNLLGKLYALGGGKNTYSDTKVVRDKSGKPLEYLITLKDSEGMDLEPISLNPGDKNLLNKVTGIYQRLTGSSKGVESEVLDEPVPKPAPKPAPAKSVLYILNGKKYNIPSDEVAEFLKDNPKAKKG
ncbi:MAG: hypothetical protein RLZZ196_234 [Bacteroidota bacterium]|jgi:hypothetical protein